MAILQSNIYYWIVMEILYIFVLLCTSISIICSLPTQSAIAILNNRLGKDNGLQALYVFSSLASLSLLSFTFSSSKPLFPHFIDLSTYIACYFNTLCVINMLWTVRFRSLLYMWCLQCIQNLNGLSIVFYCSHNTDYLPVWGSLRLAPIIIVIVLTAFDQIHTYLLGVEVTHYQELTWWYCVICVDTIFWMVWGSGM